MTCPCSSSPALPQITLRCWGTIRQPGLTDSAEGATGSKGSVGHTGPALRLLGQACLLTQGSVSRFLAGIRKLTS